MLRKFLKDSIIYTATTGISRGVSVLLLPFYTRVLQPTDYGVIDIITVLTAIVNIVIPLEISMAVARFFPDAEAREDKVTYASTALWFTASVYFLFFLISYFFSTPLSTFILEGPELTGVFQAAILSICGTGVFCLAQNQLRWQLQTKLYSIASLACTLVSITVAITLVLFLRMGVIGVIWGQLSGNVLGACLALYFGRGSYRIRFDSQKLRKMLAYSLPLVPSSMTVFVASYIDRIAIKQFMTMSDVGLYGVGYRLSSMSFLVMVGFQGALTPLIYTYFKKPETRFQVAKIFRYFLALALSVFLFLSLFSHEILTMMTTPDYYSASNLIPILVPAVLLANMYIFSPGLYLAKRTKTIAGINFGVALLNTALNLIFVPLFGIFGAATSTLMSSLLGFMLYLYMGQALYHIPHNWNPIIKAVLATVLMIIFGYSLESVFLESLIGKIFLRALICITEMLLVAKFLIEFSDVQHAYSRFFRRHWKYLFTK